jgi:hypothetical protein
MHFSLKKVNFFVFSEQSLVILWTILRAVDFCSLEWFLGFPVCVKDSSL